MSEVEVSQPQVRWLTEPEMKAWYSLVRSTTGLLAVLDNELQAEHGLTFGDYEVLVHLSAAPDHAIRMSDLAGQLRLSPSGITRRLDGLVKVGLVERRPCPNDRRGSNAVLTELGMERLSAAAPTHVRGVREHFIDRLDPGRLADLAAALDAIDIDEDSAAGGCDNV
jgi:DNA-binding MarR family transcriptional regulator